MNSTLFNSRKIKIYIDQAFKLKKKISIVLILFNFFLKYSFLLLSLV